VPPCPTVVPIFKSRNEIPLSFGQWILKSLESEEPIKMFTDATFTPISTFTLSNLINQCIEKNVCGLFHAGGKDVLSKFDFGIKVAECFDLNPSLIKPIKLEDVKFVAPRPKNMALDSTLLANKLCFDFPSIDDDIKRWKQARGSSWNQK